MNQRSEGDAHDNGQLLSGTGSTERQSSDRRRAVPVTATVQSVGVAGNADVVVSLRVASHKQRRTVGVQTD